MKAQKNDYHLKQFYNLTILDLQSDKNNHTVAICRCSCGNICQKKLSMIKIGHIKSCGCLGKATRFTKNSKHRLLNDFSKDSPISNYWAGFLFGDGNIDDSNKLQICLGLESLDHLKKFSYFLLDKDIVKVYSDRCQFQITSDVIANNLKKFGIVPRKTYNSHLILPKSKKLHSHFLRGYLDADGWISIKKTKKSKKIYESYSIGFCSYLKTNLDIVAQSISASKTECRKIKNRNLYELKYDSKKDINIVINYLFDKTIYLEHKWEKIQHLIK
ncbi:MAG: hypothetical protein EBR82_17045 [Caulobacteraceae bacterium]|nr:hypothetical protein [Caulobacteraceae bacterium]